MKFRIQQHRSGHFFLPQVRIWFRWHCIDHNGNAYIAKRPLGCHKQWQAKMHIDEFKKKMNPPKPKPEWTTIWDGSNTKGDYPGP